MRNLYKFSWDYGKEGKIDGLFTADENDVQNTIGKSISFGSKLGKYSDISGILKESDLIIVSQDPFLLYILELIFGSSVLCGYNSLFYVSEDENEC